MEYALNSQIITIEEFENVRVYGITVSNKVSDKENIIMKIENISPDKQFVEEIIRKFIIFDVSVYHIFDVIEDELYARIG